ncbi:tyrosinase family protein [Aetokthonos hydrillicola Thurmond2011]|uniref:Tyrosinase family protein n=3 Tax=Aetokthonos TaxID=1550243 RepID=A0AAP5IG72_9CYAN|nr:tyrosinase family protein [Aetokthonos hydrillicola Thurmond2011]
MVFVRKSAWAAGGDLSDPILFWYAKGVGNLKQRAIADPTSWRFLAAIHGINTQIWRNYGYLINGEQLPPQSVQSRYWNQCQHQSWYFLPWHRGYLASLEAILRDAIIKAGGPSDWALPYWNYSDTTQTDALELPPAFASQTMPDGSPNPLFVEQRYGIGSFPIKLQPDDVDVTTALQITTFSSQSRAVLGFGGPQTRFSHSGTTNGGLESTPHNIVHVRIGGRLISPTGTISRGLMTNPDTAALDPIFWLHHANIDRLWEVWLRRDPIHQNPRTNNWLNGPLERKFVVPLTDGQAWEYTPSDVLQTSGTNLNYEYDDISDPLEGATAIGNRLRTLGSPFESARSSNMENQERSVDQQTSVEMLGANSNKMALTGRRASTQVDLDNTMMRKVERSFTAFESSERSVEQQQPDRIFLNIENIRSAEDGAVIDVYINLPSGANPTDHPDLRAGTIALFGVCKASQIDQPHGGLGVTEVLDITHIVDALHLAGGANVPHLKVEFFSRDDLTPDENVTVERVSVYRERQ